MAIGAERHPSTTSAVAGPRVRARVAVTQRVVTDVRLHERRDALSHDWAQRLHQWGVTPLLVPNRWPHPEQLLVAWNATALLLTGGNTPVCDPPPRRLPEEAAPERDAVERRLIAWAVERRIPIVGACRGAEMLNLHFGGKIVAVPRGATHAGVFHPIDPVAGVDWCERIKLRRATVNSYHDYWITPAELAPPVRPFLMSEDGSVEGFYHPTLPILGVMWHPERAGPHAATLETLLTDALAGRAPWLDGVPTEGLDATRPKQSPSGHAPQILSA